MARLMGLAVLGLAALAGAAGANGYGGGQFSGNVGVTGGLSLGYGFGPKPGCGGAGGGGHLGPWYNYFPYEAHFQTPAIPMYPYWGNHTLPGGTPVLSPGYPGHGAVPSYWHP